MATGHNPSVLLTCKEWHRAEVGVCWTFGDETEGVFGEFNPISPSTDQHNSAASKLI